eukprot:NODE_1157_length_1072_cov_606.227761_g894_i0.p1 GENE.NODE_1157_length_1072_cov_606.227761_g894_i0~~NODE_1157_length_1072_cov_606.227761_g894_i0.p1  ORF type:complete len:304 (+),score=44.98 NODE_1157_length_1072_cov_606.227761_g894_i0:54-965(+)
MRIILLCALVALAHGISFLQFKEKFNRTYTGDEHSKREACFGASLKEIEVLNKQPGQTAVYGVNSLSDLCADEFRAMYTSPLNRPPTPEIVLGTESPMASSVDWRGKLVTAVKNQGSCGSCYTFAAVASMEGQYAKKHHNLTQLSDEEALDCCDCGGCGGGNPSCVIKCVSGNKGLTTTQNYPYRAGSGHVGRCQQASPVAHFGGVINSGSSENSKASWVSSNGPLAVCLYAGPWQHYSGGTMSNCPDRSSDHCVTIVGYTSSTWIIKNSWSKGWGDHGYLHLQKGTSQCGIQRYSGYSATVR